MQSVTISVAADGLYVSNGTDILFVERPNEANSVGVSVFSADSKNVRLSSSLFDNEEGDYCIVICL